MNAGDEARRYLRQHGHGVLSTNSKKLGGYPFGSVVTCVPDHSARPVIYISRLAEHTKNIDADSRVSLLVRDANTDPQAGARLTLTGDAVRATGDLAALQARFLAYVPDAARLRPFIALLADGVDCRDEAVAEYARRHDGADVPTTIMPM